MLVFICVSLKKSELICDSTTLGVRYCTYITQKCKYAKILTPTKYITAEYICVQQNYNWTQGRRWAAV